MPERAAPQIHKRSHQMNFSTAWDYSQVVSPESLERELKWMRAAAAGTTQGVFGPRSLTWQIDRGSAIFF
jgi:hypothetical protein